MTIASFAADATASFDHRRIELDRYDDVYVVGDVHGCLDSLERLLDALALGEDDLAIFVGDLVRKGPDSAGVVERVRTSPRLCSVRGNNEQKILDGDASLAAVGPTAYRYLESLPSAISWDGGVVVHGGVDPDRPLSAHASDELMTMRAPAGDGYDGPFWFDAYEGAPRVFFGHTVLERPLERRWAVGLDTGCVYGGRLTAYDVRRERIVSVPGGDHRDRSPEKIVDVEGRERTERR